MRKNKTFEAYLDTMNTITVYLANSYYQGISDQFKIKTETGLRQELEIKEIDKLEDYTRYKLAVSDIKMGQEYELVDDHHLTAPLKYGHVVRTAEFDDQFFYEGTDLGATYSQEKTVFKLWTPIASRVKIDICKDDKHQTIEMERKEQGVWRAEVEQDLELASYLYLIKVNGTWREAIDPYAIASTPNHKRTVIIDKEKTERTDNKEQLDSLKSYTDALIYELHVRNFSVAENSGITNKGKFKGLTEEGTRTERGTLTGLDYLKDLGITHVQLLPVYDFGSVDELNQFDFYNWGYDPVQYNVPEGSYASDVSDPYSRIIELKELIAKLHQNGLRVIMDVVYNHIFDRLTSAFSKIMPNYYFRFGRDGQISNGSFCGNDLDSTQKMMRKFIVDSTKMWIEEYGFDGFRFDLMGILDIETMNTIVEECKQLDPNIMIYGEGWDMPTLMADEKKATQNNSHQMPYIGHFNDRFRETIKGATMMDEITEQGYATGAKIGIKQAINVLAASVLDVGEESLFNQPTKSINYVECHDNHTLWDKMKLSNKQEPQEIRLKRQKLMNALVLVAQGISFLHAGQEFNRTKNGVENSYMSDDKINQIDWDRKDEYSDTVNYTKDFIELRKLLKPLRFDSTEEIEEHVSFKTITNGEIFNQGQVVERGVVVYQIKDVQEYCPYQEILIIINPTLESVAYELGTDYLLLADETGLTNDEEYYQEVTISPLELLVLVAE
jgi:pullulanase